MKILEIIFSLSSGGGERFVVDLCNEMSKTEDVTLLLLKDSHSPDDNRNFYKDEVSERVKCINLDLPDGFHFSSQWKIYKAIKKINPEVVHYHLCNMPKFIFFALMMLNKKYKFVETIHNDIRTSYSSLFHKTYFKLFGNSKKVDFACISATNYDDMQNIYPNCDSRMIVNGRASQDVTENFQEVKKELDTLRQDRNGVLLLNVARCNPQKNHQLLIEAVNQLNEEGVNVDVAIVGDGFKDTGLGKKITCLAGKHIHFLGPRKGIADYMKSSDALCLSSVHEGMPITLIEAMLCGVPMISTPVCGSVDVIEDGKNGILSKDFSLKEYKTAIKRFIDNQDSIKNNIQMMSANSPYSMKNCSLEYLRMFKELTKK